MSIACGESADGWGRLVRAPQPPGLPAVTPPPPRPGWPVRGCTDPHPQPAARAGEERRSVMDQPAATVVVSTRFEHG